MRFIELAEKRRSVRGYSSEPVSDADLKEVLQAGALAPTAKNLQPFQFVVVREAATLQALATGYPAPLFREAPVAIVVCVEHEKGWIRPFDEKNFSEVDAAIAMDHMTLAASDLDLGTCWIGYFDAQPVSKLLVLPESVEPLCMILLGHPNDEPRKKVRKPLEELVRYERW